MGASSGLLVYSLANFNGTIVFQIHHQDADFTRWVYHHEPTYNGFTVTSASVPEIRSTQIFLRGKTIGADNNVVTYTPGITSAETLIAKIHKALKKSVSRYRRKKHLDAVKPAYCTVHL